MGFKEFFKKNLMNSLILTLTLLVISTLITFMHIPFLGGIQTYGIPFSRGGDGYFPPKIYSGIGFPLMFYAYDLGEWAGNTHFSSLCNYYNFIIDIIFWYIISCLSILIYSKLKKKKIKRIKSKKRKK